MSKLSSFFKFKQSKNTRRYQYYNRENIVKNWKDLETIFNSTAKQEYNTTKLIKHSGLALSEIDEASLLRVLEDPDFIMDDLDDLENYKILFYRRTVDDFAFLLQFHFLKGNFVFVSNKITAKGVLSKTERADLIRNIAEKYLTEELELDLKKKFNIKISDETTNYFKIVDEVDFRINYVNNCSKNQQQINKQISQIEVPEDDLKSRISELL